MGTRGRLPPGPIGGRDCLVREGNSSRKMSDRQTVGTIATVATYGLTASIRFHVPSTVTFGLKPPNSLRTYWLPPPAQAGPYWLLNSTGIGIAERLHTADCLVPLVRFPPKLRHLLVRHLQHANHLRIPRPCPVGNISIAKRPSGLAARNTRCTISGWHAVFGLYLHASLKLPVRWNQQAQGLNGTLKTVRVNNGHFLHPVVFCAGGVHLGRHIAIGRS